jgi:hypothetical protein
VSVIRNLITFQFFDAARRTPLGHEKAKKRVGFGCEGGNGHEKEKIEMLFLVRGVSIKKQNTQYN